MQAIAMATDKTSCRDDVNRTKHFLNSLGRYGNTPFLWPMYGSGELPQCFCRLCAVFGGIYCLKRQLDGVVVNEDKCKAIISGRQRFALEHLVVGQGHLPPEIVASEGENQISRKIFITDRSIMQGEEESLTFLYYSPEEQDQGAVTLIELGPSTNACPQGLFIIHMTCKRTKNAKKDLAYVVNKFLRAEPLQSNAVRSSSDSHTQTVSPDKRHLQDDRQEKEETEYPVPQVLWSLYLNLPASDIKLSDSAPSNIHLCSGPDLELDFDFAVNQVGSGEIPLDDEEWEEWKGIASEEFEDTFRTMISCSPQAVHPEIIDTNTRKRGSLMSALYSDGVTYERDSCHSITVAVSSKPSTMERQTQTELILPIWRQFLYCLAGDDAFRRRRQREAASNYRKCGDRMSRRHINSVSYIDRVALSVFPASFGLLNVCYWVAYVTYQEEFKWQDPPIGSITPISH
ncbi:rab proteins geranylgeranyltransferase component A 1-like isoform X2 [Temnothorax longispinosus]|uniref:rab proteins geranylgeranyltransferase component A 1-like isoform X2 n=1 Tax=Temnothorax longispinosus TaxID=300112 RepID=UPI003A9912A8